MSESPSLPIQNAGPSVRGTSGIPMKFSLSAEVEVGTLGLKTWGDLKQFTVSTWKALLGLCLSTLSFSYAANTFPMLEMTTEFYSIPKPTKSDSSYDAIWGFVDGAYTAKGYTGEAVAQYFTNLFKTNQEEYGKRRKRTQEQIASLKTCDTQFCKNYALYGESLLNFFKECNSGREARASELFGLTRFYYKKLEGSLPSSIFLYHRILSAPKDSAKIDAKKSFMGVGLGDVVPSGFIEYSHRLRTETEVKEKTQGFFKVYVTEEPIKLPGLENLEFEILLYTRNNRVRFIEAHFLDPNGNTQWVDGDVAKKFFDALNVRYGPDPYSADGEDQFNYWHWRMWNGRDVIGFLDVFSNNAGSFGGHLWVTLRSNLDEMGSEFNAHLEQKQREEMNGAQKLRESEERKIKEASEKL